MRDEDHDRYKIEVSVGIDKFVNFLRVRFKSRGKILKVVELHSDNDSKVVVIQTDKGDFICVIRKMKTKLRIAIMDLKTGKIQGMMEI
jgi:hypothetical protein